MYKKTLSSIAFTALLAVGLVGCAADPEGGDSEGSTVHLGIAAFDALTWSAHHVAEGQGYLDEELGAAGDDWEVTKFDGGGPLFTALTAGDVDLAMVPTTVVMSLNHQDRDLQCVMMMSQGGSNLLVGRADLEASHGDDLTTFDGGTFGYSSEGSNGRQILQMVVEDAGMSWDDQNGIALGSAAAYEPALATSKVDIVVTDPTSAQLALDNDTGYIVLNANDPDDARFPYPNAGNCLAGSAKWIQENPELVEAVVRAEVRGLQAIQEVADDSKAVVALFAPRTEGEWSSEEFALVAGSLAALDPAPNEATVNDTKKWTERADDVTIDDDVAASTFTSEYVDRAVQSLG